MHRKWKVPKLFNEVSAKDFEEAPGKEFFPWKIFAMHVRRYVQVYLFSSWVGK